MRESKNVDKRSQLFSENGMEWNGMEWNGMEWNGMEWNGMEWNGMEEGSSNPAEIDESIIFNRGEKSRTQQC